jgi:hypothetical protein
MKWILGIGGMNFIEGNEERNVFEDCEKKVFSVLRHTSSCDGKWGIMCGVGSGIFITANVSDPGM